MTSPLASDALRAHRDFLEGLVPLSCWYARCLADRTAIPLEEALSEHTNLYRQTVHFDGTIPPGRSAEHPGWIQLCGELEALRERLPDPRTFERAATEHIWPSVEPRIPESVAEIQRRIRESAFSCWSADLLPELVKIHFFNAYQPDSPFRDHADAILSTLGALVKQIVEERGPSVTIFCGSWLNNLPVFQRLFPSPWVTQAQEFPEIRWGLGQWGQFMDHKGEFHHANAKFFRLRGQLRYPCLECTAPAGAILQHLKKLLA